VPVSGLPVASLQELVAAAAGASQRLAGIASRAVAELQIRGQGVVPDPVAESASLPTAAWLRHAAKLTSTDAGRQIRTAVSLRELPDVADAIVEGGISPRHGRALARLVGIIEPQALLDSQPQLLEMARRCDPHALEKWVSHWIATHSEPLLDDEERAAEDRRFLQMRDTDRGTIRGSFELPNAIGEIVRSVIEPLARKNGDDARTAGQRRADAMADVFGLALRFGELPDAGGSRPVLTYVVPVWWSPGLAATMERLSTDPLATPGVGDRPGSLGVTTSSDGSVVLDLDQHPGRDIATAPWTGPATRSRIDTLLCDSRVQRVVLDAHGQVVSLESVNDDITAAQRRAVAARDRCCVAKGCTRPPAFCDVHHLRARADGGRSSIGNLVLLCRRHHVMWHRDQIGLSDLRIPWLRVPSPTSQPRAPALE
jgi:hypothetical protein